MTNTTAAKNAKISAILLSKIADGLTMPEAFDEVFGLGSYKAFADGLYDALRAKAGLTA